MTRVLVKEKVNRFGVIKSSSHPIFSFSWNLEKLNAAGMIQPEGTKGSNMATH